MRRSRPQLFRLRDDAAIAVLGHSGQGQFKAAGIELRIFLRALAFMQNDDRAGLESRDDSLRYSRWIAPDRVEPPNGPTDELELAAVELRMDKNIL